MFNIYILNKSNITNLTTQLKLFYKIWIKGKGIGPKTRGKEENVKNTIS